MKRGQEEIIGFVAIVILLAVIFLVFLVISFRSPVEDIRENSEAYYFLSSVMEVTSNCTRGLDNQALKIAELASSCRQNDKCNNDLGSCDVLNMTLNYLVQEGFRPGEDSVTKGYVLKTRYVSNLSSGQTGQDISSISSGVCGNSFSGASYSVPDYPGVITFELKLCS
ncbi:MAG: hypothetical protein AABW79_04665 [Nanoarchaeota archaeon]